MKILIAFMIWNFPFKYKYVCLVLLCRQIIRAWGYRGRVGCKKALSGGGGHRQLYDDYQGKRRVGEVEWGINGGRKSLDSGW